MKTIVFSCRHSFSAVCTAEEGNVLFLRKVEKKLMSFKMAKIYQIS